MHRGGYRYFLTPPGCGGENVPKEILVSEKFAHLKNIMP